jgi:hypothetical protein
MKEQFIKNENEKEGKKKQNKPRFKEEEYTSKNKYPSDIEDEEKKEDEEISYLDIFQRPSFRNVRKNIMSTEDHSVLEVDNFEQEKTKDQYDYPVNIFKKFLFTWTRKVLKASNSKPQLEISDLGKFSPELYPDNFLREIKQAWEKISKKTKNSPLIKTLLYNNISVLILIFIGNIFVCGSETLNVLLYRQVILHLDEEPESESLFDL